LAEDGSFLRRWSRRKVEARDDKAGAGDVHEPAAAAEMASAAPAAAPSPPARQSDAEADRETGRTALPDIESLTEQSDFSVFMGDGVPPDLRTRALQKLWRLDPAFSEMDGLRDYADDYSDRAVATGVVRTLYKVGRGFMRDAEADEDDAAAPEAIAARDPDTPAHSGAETTPADAAESLPADEDSGEDPAGAGGGDGSDSKA
jgi:hypothetical protein